MKFGEEQRSLVDCGGALVFLHRGECVGANGDYAFLGSFPPDLDAFVHGVDLLNIESGQFGEAESGGIEEFEDRRITERHPFGGLFFEGKLQGKSEKFFDLGQGEDDREWFVCFGEFYFGDRAFWVATPVHEVFVKGSEGRKAEADGASF